jgi:hypothetical protein
MSSYTVIKLWVEISLKAVTPKYYLYLGSSEGGFREAVNQKDQSRLSRAVSDRERSRCVSIPVCRYIRFFRVTIIIILIFSASNYKSDGVFSGMR